MAELTTEQMSRGVFGIAEEVLRLKPAIEEAERARDQAVAARDAALAAEAESLARATAAQRVVGECEAHLAELAAAIGPAERAAQEAAITLRAEVADLTRQQANLQQLLWQTRQQQDAADDVLKRRKLEMMSMGRGGGQARMDEMAAAYERRIALLETELRRFSGETIASILTDPPPPLPDDGATDTALLAQWAESPEGQRWQQAQGGAHG